MEDSHTFTLSHYDILTLSHSTLTLSHSHTVDILTLSLSHPHTLTLSHSPTHTLSTHTLSHPHTLTYSHSHTHTLTLTLTLKQALLYALLRGSGAQLRVTPAELHPSLGVWGGGGRPPPECGRFV